jgi:hypothetical protein
MNALWWFSRPFVWRWRLGYWDWDASRVALRLAFTMPAGRSERAT